MTDEKLEAIAILRDIRQKIQDFVGPEVPTSSLKGWLLEISLNLYKVIILLENDK
jgi:hypothetical protein